MNTVLIAILEWLLGKILKFLGREIKSAQETHKIEEKADQDLAMLKKAESKDEKQAAADRLASDSF